MEQLTSPHGMNLGPETSKQFATGLLTMPKLRTFDLNNVDLDDSFFLGMSELGHKSQVSREHKRTHTHTHTHTPFYCKKKMVFPSKRPVNVLPYTSTIYAWKIT